MDLDSIYEIADTDNEINNIIDQDSYNRLISRLNDKEKEVVSLKVLTNLTFDEIAKLLNESAGTVKWRYYKSIHTLKLLLSNLGMFIITFIIGLKTMTINKNKIQSEQSTVPDNEAVQEKEDSQNIKESIPQEESKNTDLEDVYKEENNIKQEEIQVPVDNKHNNINYYDIGIIAISSVFLLFTIIFLINFTKYQLKRKVKASK